MSPLPHHAGRTRTILALSGPIVVFFLIQNAMSFAALAMAGVLGGSAPAGVTVGSALYSTLLATLFGLDTAVQAIVARRTGQGDHDRAAEVWHAAMIVSGFAGAMLTTLALVFGPPVITAILGPGEAARHGAAYFHGASVPLAFMGLTIAFNAYWNGTGRPRIGLIATFVELPCGLAAAWVLAFPFGYGVFGIGAGLAGAALLGLLVHAGLAIRFVPASALRPRTVPPAEILQVLRLGLPVSAQQCLLYVGVMAMIALVAPLGSESVAALGIISTLLLVAILPATGFGVAAATLVGMALGRANQADARRWGWQTALLGSALLLPVSIGLAIDPGFALRLFTADAAAHLAETPMRLIACVICIDSFGRILAFALRGAGDTARPTAVAFAMQWAVQLPLTWLVGIVFGHGLLGMAAVRAGVTLVESMIYAGLWWRGRWTYALDDVTPPRRGAVPGPA